jgi:hypothetical protein
MRATMDWPATMQRRVGIDRPRPPTRQPLIPASERFRAALRRSLAQCAHAFGGPRSYHIGAGGSARKGVGRVPSRAKAQCAAQRARGLRE